MTFRNLQDRPLNEVPLVVLDTETTGLMPQLGHRVVEIAAVRLVGWRETARVSSLVNPGRPIDPGASRVNGIYDDDLVDAPPFSDVFLQLQSLLEGALLVAHNALFDASFLSMEYHLLGQEQGNDLAATLSNPWLCTLQLARRQFYFDSNSLGNVARRLNVSTGRSHRALNDAYTTAGVLKQMAHELGAYGLHSAGDFVHAQGGPIYAPVTAPIPLPPSIARAIESSTPVQIIYTGPNGVRTSRLVTPKYVSRHHEHVYLIAFCHLRQAQRTFRLDRIVCID